MAVRRGAQLLDGRRLRRDGAVVTVSAVARAPTPVGQVFAVLHGFGAVHCGTVQIRILASHWLSQRFQ